MSNQTRSVKPWQKQLPNVITISRIVFVPLIVVALYYEEPYGGIIAAYLFVMASIGDWLDGYLARLYHVESILGKFMDPISDKILVTCTLVMMIPTKEIHPVLIILLLMRDTLINGLRSVAASENIIIAAGQMGKWKTALQMVAIPCVLVEIPLGPFPTYEVGIWGLWLSVILSVVSGIQYVTSFIQKRA